jgi:hypothetical protein
MNKRKHPKPVFATTKVTSDLDRIVASVGNEGSGWCRASLQNLEGIPDNPGVYCFVLPESDLPKERRLILHGRTFGPKDARRQLQFRFEYSATALTRGSDLVIYVGKASNLRARLKSHRSVNRDATTNQVLRGLVGKPYCDLNTSELEGAWKNLIKHGTVYYFKHAHDDEIKNDPATMDEVGQSSVAERDLLEIKLIAKYAPPFNLKAER